MPFLAGNLEGGVMRIIIELPDAAGEKAKLLQESTSTTVEAPSEPKAVATEQAIAEDGGSPSQQLLYALGSTEQTLEDEATTEEVSETGTSDGGGVAPWLVDLIKGGAPN
jgi:hypothetical protein